MSEYDRGRLLMTFDGKVLDSLRDLHETLVMITQVASDFDYRPADADQLYDHLIGWAVEWEEEFRMCVRAGSLHIDERDARTVAFAVKRLEMVREHCNNWELRYSALPETYRGNKTRHH